MSKIMKAGKCDFRFLPFQVNSSFKVFVKIDTTSTILFGSNLHIMILDLRTGGSFFKFLVWLFVFAKLGLN